MRKKKEPFVLKNPFSDDFLIAWDFWKKFKKEQFYFTHKPIGEQLAIDELFEMANGDENTAKLIIKQSIVKGWRGLFPLKNVANGKQQSYSETREGVTDVLSRRNYERG